MDDFIVFILSHGRADHVVTYDTLKDQGYTGRVGIVIDDEDSEGAAYREKFGEENVFTFSKSEIAKSFDEVIKGDRRTVVYARNACFEIAKKIGVKYFMELDDDYYYFSFAYDNNLLFVEPRRNGGVSRYKNIKDLDHVFSLLLDYYKNTPRITSIAIAQAGDFIGGGNSSTTQRVWLKRKAMNSFLCSVDRPFHFTGRINEDVNTYTMEAQKGLLFFSTNFVYLDQEVTQNSKGGMTDVYLDSGTYLKSFFSVIVAPSCVKVATMRGKGTVAARLHHQISWKNCTPVILRETIKKQRT